VAAIDETRFVLSMDCSSYEIWIFHCSLTDYRLKFESRSKSGIVWWTVNGSEIDYLFCDPSTHAFSFVGVETANLPSFHRIPTELHSISSKFGHNCLDSILEYLFEAIAIKGARIGCFLASILCELSALLRSICPWALSKSRAFQTI
jgi:hypothetical protein